MNPTMIYSQTHLHCQVNSLQVDRGVKFLFPFSNTLGKIRCYDFCVPHHGSEFPEAYGYAPKTERTHH